MSGINNLDSACLIRGPTGLAGPPGPPGETGLAGNPGKRGIDGPPGPVGFPGPPGQMGSGLPGLFGPPGQAGIPGPVGPQGGDGPMGAPGVVGIVGPQGAPGETGRRGPQGTQGQTGATGPQGNFNFFVEAGNDGCGTPTSGPVTVNGGDTLRFWSAGGMEFNAVDGSVIMQIEFANIISQSGQPSGDPSDPKRSAILFDTVTKRLWFWDVLAGLSGQWRVINLNAAAEFSRYLCGRTGTHIQTLSNNSWLQFGLNKNSTGFICASIPDGSLAGGFCRGKNAVDWQAKRQKPSQIAQGDYSAILGGRFNVATGTYSVILGGQSNISAQSGSFAGGGSYNEARRIYNVILGGKSNVTRVNYAILIGGRSNTVSGTGSFIGGGVYNKANSVSSLTANSELHAGLFGGHNNAVDGPSAFVGGGRHNLAFGDYSVVFGGSSNSTKSTGKYNSVLGGRANTGSTYQATIIGGFNNNLSGTGSWIGNGPSNTLSQSNSFLGNGVNLSVGDTTSFILNGRNVTTDGAYAWIGNGLNSTADGNRTIILVGTNNLVIGQNSVVLGGFHNQIRVENSLIMNGSFNSISQTGGLIVTGKHNVVSGSNSLIGAGISNMVSGFHSQVPIGRANVVSGNYSTVFGSQKTVTDSGVVLAGGLSNLNQSSSYGFVGGGHNNQIVSSNYSVIGGGLANLVTGAHYSVCVGGCSNKLYAQTDTSTLYNVVFGGTKNEVGFNGATGTRWSSILGGLNNKINDYFNVIMGGSGNLTDSPCTFIGGGQNNTIIPSTGAAHSKLSTIGGGSDNIIIADMAVIGGGRYLTAAGNLSALIGGHNNITLGTGAFIGGSSYSTAGGSGTATFIGGGKGHIITGDFGAMMGGYVNFLKASESSVIAGGFKNVIETPTGSQNCVVISGRRNEVLSTRFRNSTVYTSAQTYGQNTTLYENFVERYRSARNLGLMGYTRVSLAFHPQTGILYGIGMTLSFNEPYLFQILDGVVSYPLAFDNTAISHIGDMDFRPSDNTLFFVTPWSVGSVLRNSLFTVDLDTGVTTQVAQYLSSSDYYGGFALAFDPYTEILYNVLWDDVDELVHLLALDADTGTILSYDLLSLVGFPEFVNGNTYIRVRSMTYDTVNDYFLCIVADGSDEGPQYLGYLVVATKTITFIRKVIDNTDGLAIRDNTTIFTEATGPTGFYGFTGAYSVVPGPSGPCSNSCVLGGSGCYVVANPNIIVVNSVNCESKTPGALIVCSCNSILTTEYDSTYQITSKNNALICCSDRESFGSNNCIFSRLSGTYSTYTKNYSNNSFLGPVSGSLNNLSGATGPFSENVFVGLGDVNMAYGTYGLSPNAENCFIGTATGLVNSRNSAVFGGRNIRLPSAKPGAYIESTAGIGNPSFETGSLAPWVQYGVSYAFTRWVVLSSGYYTGAPAYFTSNPSDGTYSNVGFLQVVVPYLLPESTGFYQNSITFPTVGAGVTLNVAFDWRIGWGPGPGSFTGRDVQFQIRGDGGSPIITDNVIFSTGLVASGSGGGTYIEDITSLAGGTYQLRVRCLMADNSDYEVYFEVDNFRFLTSTAPVSGIYYGFTNSSNTSIGYACSVPVDLKSGSSYVCLLENGFCAPGTHAILRGTNSAMLGYNGGGTADGAIAFNRSFDGDNTCTINSYGGAYVHSSNITGVQMSSGATSWSAISDRNIKTNLRTIDSLEILNKINQMEVPVWNVWTDKSKTVAHHIDHLGPMAQDFYEAFELGDSDRMINMIDIDGVNLAAIQGLDQLVTQLANQTSIIRNPETNKFVYTGTVVLDQDGSSVVSVPLEPEQLVNTTFTYQLSPSTKSCSNLYVEKELDSQSGKFIIGGGFSELTVHWQVICTKSS